MERTPDNNGFSSDLTDFLFNNLSSAIFLVDRTFRVRKVNNAFRTLFMHGEQTLPEGEFGNLMGCSATVNPPRACTSAPECASCSLRNCIAQSFADTGSTHAATITRIFGADGTGASRFFNIVSRLVPYDNGELVIVALDDGSEIMELNRRIREMANRDPLTGLSNRGYFIDLARNLFENAKRGNISVSAAVFAVDNFRRIAETCGRDIADYVIKAVSGILVEHVRKADLLGRFSAGEFGILLHCSDNEDAYTVIEKLRLLVEQYPFVYDGRTIDVTISAGLTTTFEDSLDAMLGKAEEMLALAVRNGADRTEEYVPPKA